METQCMLNTGSDNGFGGYRNIDDEQLLKNYGLTNFRDFCVKRGVPSFKNIPKLHLASLVKEFFEQTRNKQGQIYSVRSLRRFRFGLNSYFRTLYGDDFDMGRDSAFYEVNNTFQVVTKQLSRPSRIMSAPTADTVVITPEDLTKIGEYFWKVINTPRGLQQKVWFDLMIHIGGDGIENQHAMRKDSFVIMKSSSDGRRRLQWRFGGRSRGPPIMEDPDNPLCPVKTFQLYLNKLNLACPAFFQRPHEGITKSSRFWYHMFPLNNTMLALMMYDISKDAGLSRVYPNFCTQVLPEKNQFYKLFRKGYLSLENFCTQPLKSKDADDKESSDKSVLEPISSEANFDDSSSGSGEVPKGPIPFKLCAQCLSPVKIQVTQKNKGILCSVPCFESFMKAKEMNQKVKVSFKDGTRVPQYTIPDHGLKMAPSIPAKIPQRLQLQPQSIPMKRTAKGEVQLLGKNIPDDVFEFIQQVAKIQAAGLPAVGVPMIYKEDGTNADSAWELPTELLEMTMDPVDRAALSASMSCAQRKGYSHQHHHQMQCDNKRQKLDMSSSSVNSWLGYQQCSSKGKREPSSDEDSDEES